MGKELDHPEYQIRSWALGHALDANDKGTSAEKIVSDAEKFYGFMFPQNGKVTELPAQSRRHSKKDRHDVFIPPAPVTPEDVKKQEEIERAFLQPTHDKYLDFADRLEKESVSSPSKPGEKQEVAQTKMPEKFPKPTPKLTKAPEKLTQRNLDALAAIIALNRINVMATQREIARRTSIGHNNVSYCLKRLIEREFIVEKKQGKILCYIALKNKDGKPVFAGEETGITKCPPRYASGYGYKKSEFEDIL